MSRSGSRAQLPIRRRSIFTRAPLGLCPPSLHSTAHGRLGRAKGAPYRCWLGGSVHCRGRASQRWRQRHCRSRDDVAPRSYRRSSRSISDTAVHDRTGVSADRGTKSRSDVAPRTYQRSSSPILDLDARPEPALARTGDQESLRGSASHVSTLEPSVSDIAVRPRPGDPRCDQRRGRRSSVVDGSSSRRSASNNISPGPEK